MFRQANQALTMYQGAGTLSLWCERNSGLAHQGRIAGAGTLSLWCERNTARRAKQD